jgi:anaerobic ribonucleoside-triphosphate reductase activating protein
MDNYYDEMMYSFSEYDGEEYGCEPPEWGFRYLSVTHDDMLNGDGLRVVLWVSGCSHACPGCQNAYSWDDSFGQSFTEETKGEIFSYLSKDYVQGITFSGGDPLFIHNRAAIGSLVREIKGLFPEKDIWVYTGYELAYSRKKKFFFREAAPWKKEKDEFYLDWLSYIDVLCDGLFLADVRKQDIENGCDPHWVGSSNQRVIDVARSIEIKNIVIKEDSYGS